MGMLMARTLHKQREETPALNEAETPVEEASDIEEEIPFYEPEKAPEVAKKPVKRATKTTRKTPAKRKTSK